MRKQGKLFLAVDYDGTEKASNSPLVRMTKFRRLSHWFLSKNKRQTWIDTWSNESGRSPLFFSGVVLPRGTIEKIAGVKWSWKDEPIEFEL